MKQDLDGDGDSGADEVGSDIENVDELRGWLSSNSAKSPFLPNQILVRKFLPPGNVMELYEEYKATQQMLGGTMFRILVILGPCSQKKIYIYICIYQPIKNHISFVWLGDHWMGFNPPHKGVNAVNS